MSRQLRTLVFVAAGVLARPAAAIEKTYQNDKFIGNGNATVVRGFIAGEAAAAVFQPEPGDYPVILKRLQFFMLPTPENSAGTTGQFLIKVWRDPADGTADPSGTPIVDGVEGTLNATKYGETNQVLQEVSLDGLDSPAVITSGSFRVGLFYQLAYSDPTMLMSIAADMGPIVPGRNFIYAVSPIAGWVSFEQTAAAANQAAVNFIIRAVCEVTAPTIPDGGTPDGGTPDGGTTDGGSPANPGGPPLLNAITPSLSVNGSATPVVVQGDNFVAGTVIQIGDFKLQSLSIDPPKIANGTVPASIPPGIYDLSATNPDGKHSLLPHAFTVSASTSIASSGKQTTKGGCQCGSTSTPELVGLAALLWYFARRARPH